MSPSLFPLVVVILGIAAVVIFIVFFARAEIRAEKRSSGYLCPNGHWHASGAHCPECGAATVFHEWNPKCPNSHKRIPGDSFCRVCGVELIKDSVEGSPDQAVEPANMPKYEEEKSKKKQRLFWRVALVVVGIALLTWVGTNYLQVWPLRDNVKVLQADKTDLKKECADYYEKYKSLRSAAEAREKAYSLAKEKGQIWIPGALYGYYGQTLEGGTRKDETITVTAVFAKNRGEHLNTLQGGKMELKPVKSHNSFYSYSKDIEFGKSGIKMWKNAFLRGAKKVRLEFHYVKESPYVGDYLKPVVVE